MFSSSAPCSNDDTVAGTVAASSEEADERCWRNSDHKKKREKKHLANLAGLGGLRGDLHILVSFQAQEKLTSFVLLLNHLKRTNEMKKKKERALTVKLG